MGAGDASGSDPYMAVAVSGPKPGAGVAIAEINLKPISDIVSAIHVGETGQALVLDGAGRLVAHPTSALAPAARATPRACAAGRGARWRGEGRERRRRRGPLGAGRGGAYRGPGLDGLCRAADRGSLRPDPRGVVADRPSLLAGAAFAAALAYGLARRIAGPLQQIEQGVARIVAGRFDQPIELRTGDELERLAGASTKWPKTGAVAGAIRAHRPARALPPARVAELVESEGQRDLLNPHRAEVAVIFCDLRGFTAFSTQAEPDEVMGLLGEYHQAIGKVVVSWEATTTSVMGDGLMLLINAPVPCRDPAMRAARMAIDMQGACRR